MLVQIHMIIRWLNGMSLLVVQLFIILRRRKLMGVMGELALSTGSFKMHCGVWNIRGINDPMKQHEIRK